MQRLTFSSNMLISTYIVKVLFRDSSTNFGALGTSAV
jgi:hypothetical protein